VARVAQQASRDGAPRACRLPGQGDRHRRRRISRIVRRAGARDRRCARDHRQGEADGVRRPRRSAHRRVRDHRPEAHGHRRPHRRPDRRPRSARRGARLPDREGSRGGLRAALRRSRHTPSRACRANGTSTRSTAPSPEDFTRTLGNPTACSLQSFEST